MLWVQWGGVLLGKFHLTTTRVTTMCDRQIPNDAQEHTKPPRDKSKICKRCQQIESEESKFRSLK